MCIILSDIYPSGLENLPPSVSEINSMIRRALVGSVNSAAAAIPTLLLIFLYNRLLSIACSDLFTVTYERLILREN